MRYFTAILFVLALSSRAMSQCSTSDKHFGPRDDTELPDSLGPYNVEDCSIFLFRIGFQRTGFYAGINTLIVEIRNSNVYCVFPSFVYRQGNHTFPPSGWFKGAIDQGAAENTIVASLINEKPLNLFHHIDVWVQSFQ